ncbi:MAG: 3-carboxy-cis,cis-muconate cycloisomerase [Vicinamibacterales bacterium]
MRTRDAAVAFTPALSVEAMLDVEAALAEALADVGVIPASSAEAIRAAARAELYDVDALLEEAVGAGNLLIPIVQQLIGRVASLDRAAAGHVHWGATSQDVMDTALVLRLRAAAGDIVQSLTRAADAAADLAGRHVATPMAGRTWLQQATPTTFGAKAATWLDAIVRARRHLASSMEAALELQLGGATGTLSSLGADGPRVAQALAARLQLRVADIPWHTERSRIAGVACALGMTCGSLGKIGRDIALLAQTEVGEVSEPSSAGRGGSSSMPHKRNPVASAVVAAAAVQAPGLVATMLSAMPQEHERALGGWQAEWETLPALVTLASRSARTIADTLPYLVVDVARMRTNLDAAGGVARAEGLVRLLAPHLGRNDALSLVKRVCDRTIADGGSLHEVAAAEPQIREHLNAEQIANALDPASFLGATRTFIDRTLERWRRERDGG